MKQLIFLLVVVQFAIVLILSKNLDKPYLWTDECVQFWISKGLVDKSPPNSTSGDVFDVIEMNQISNLDPGGFGIILHYWLKVSNGHQWQRLLPFLFFLSSMLLFFLLSLEWTKSYLISICAALIPTLSPMLVHYGFEVRPYSMEYLGVMLSLYFLYKTLDSYSNKKYVFFIISLCFAMTSRYSSFITSAIFFLIYFFNYLYKNKNLKKSILHVLPGGLVILSMAIFIYFIAIKHQNPSIEPPQYLIEKLLKFNYGFLLKPTFIIYNLPAIFFIISWFALKQKNSPIVKKYNLFLQVLIAQNLVFILLSFLGIHSWDISSRWSISLHILSFVALIALVGLIVDYFQELGYFNLSQLTLPVIVFSFIAIIAHLKLDVLNYKEGGSIVESLKAITPLDDKRVLVDLWEFGTVKYLYEYGVLKNAKTHSIYPSKFDFKKLETEDFVECLDDIDPKVYQIAITPDRYFNQSNCPKGNESKWKAAGDSGKIWINQ